MTRKALYPFLPGVVASLLVFQDMYRHGYRLARRKSGHGKPVPE
jgi:hypothetical protein